MERLGRHTSLGTMRPKARTLSSTRQRQMVDGLPLKENHPKYFQSEVLLASH